MENYTTPKQTRKVVQLSVFVLPEEKLLIEQKAKEEGRAVSNFCKNVLLQKIKNQEVQTTDF